MVPADIADAVTASWLLQFYPRRVRVTLAIAGGAVLFLLRDTSSGRPAGPPRELAPIRAAAIAAARGFLPPFAWWTD